MTVSLAEATAAARRIQAGDYGTRTAEQAADARLLAGFVLAGDTERLRETVGQNVQWAIGVLEALTYLHRARAALAEGSP